MKYACMYIGPPPSERDQRLFYSAHPELRLKHGSKYCRVYPFGSYSETPESYPLGVLGFWNRLGYNTWWEDSPKSEGYLDHVKPHKMDGDVLV